MYQKGPDPETKYPLPGYDKLVFLKHFIKAPNIYVGDYTYYDDRHYGPESFEDRNVLYNYDHSKVKLVFGKFCAIAAGTKFIMTGDHKLNGFSTFPFPIFQQGWENCYNIFDLPVKGDILVGSDVWFGYESMVKNGVSIGHGAIIAAGTFVVKDVPPYAIVAGNPGKIVKMRFKDEIIEKLIQIAWWDWEIDKLNRHLSIISQLDIDKLQEAALQP